MIDAISYDFCYLLTRLAWSTMINNRKRFLDFLVKSRDCDVRLADVTKMEKTGFLLFRQKYILSERASEEEQTTENRFSMRHVWARLWDFKNISVRPPDP